MFRNISIIGVGNLSQALLYCIKNKSLKFNINLYDLDKKKKVFASKKEWSFNAKINKKLAESDLVILAVKPNQYKDACSKINVYAKNKVVIVSLMAGITIKDLEKEFSDKLSIARVMTNINAKYSSAISSIYIDKQFRKDKIVSLKKFFSLFGSIKILKSESQINKITALIGSGPAYFIYFAESMVKTFQSFGFTKYESELLVCELFYGTAKTCITDKRSLNEIKKSVVSKGGTTEAALKKFDKLKTKKIVMESIREAFIRAEDLGKGK